MPVNVGRSAGSRAKPGSLGGASMGAASGLSCGCGRSLWIGGPRLRSYLSEDFLGGPRVLKLNWVINFQKGGTLPFVLALMALDRHLDRHRLDLPRPARQLRPDLAAQGRRHARRPVADAHHPRRGVHELRAGPGPVLAGPDPAGRRRHAAAAVAAGLRHHRLRPGRGPDDGQRRSEVLHPAAQARPDHDGMVRPRAPPQLPGRDGAVRVVRRGGRALDPVAGPGVGVAGPVRAQHARQGGQHEPLPGMGGVQGPHGHAAPAVPPAVPAADAEAAPEPPASGPAARVDAEGQTSAAT